LAGLHHQGPLGLQLRIVFRPEAPLPRLGDRGGARIVDDLFRNAPQKPLL